MQDEYAICFVSAARDQEREVDTVSETNEESRDQNDPWQKLKDFAG
jgi:molecular chaperone DnaJ